MSDLSDRNRRVFKHEMETPWREHDEDGACCREAVEAVTLTDFLLARIADDEEAAVCADGVGCPNQDFEFGPGLTDCNKLNVGPNRWRAECEAKRRIVEQWEMTQPPASGADYAVEQELEIAMFHLASVYADHPDYNPDWRP